MFSKPNYVFFVTTWKSFLNNQLTISTIIITSLRTWVIAAFVLALAGLCALKFVMWIWIFNKSSKIERKGGLTTKSWTNVSTWQRLVTIFVTTSF